MATVQFAPSLSYVVWSINSNMLSTVVYIYISTSTCTLVLVSWLAVLGLAAERPGPTAYPCGDCVERRQRATG